MNKTLVIGANGQIGRMLVKMMAAENLPVRAMVRKAEQTAEFEALGVDTVVADLEGDFSAVFDGCEKLVFSAGSGAATGPDKTLLVDLWGAVKAIDLAKEKGVEHFIMVSSFNCDNPDKGPVAIKPYLVAKFAADHYLEHSGQVYTILRPARLTDEAGSGKVRTDRPERPEERIIPREDVALAALYCVKNDHAKGQVFDLCQGDVELDKALEP